MSACAGGLKFVRGIDERWNISRTTMVVVTLYTRRWINCFHGLVKSESRLPKHIHVASEHQGDIGAFAVDACLGTSLGVRCCRPSPYSPRIAGGETQWLSSSMGCPRHRHTKTCVFAALTGCSPPLSIAWISLFYSNVEARQSVGAQVQHSTCIGAVRSGGIWRSPST
jgi:hypothetical protein